MKQYKLLEGFHSLLPQEAIVPSQPSDVQEGDYVKIGVETGQGFIATEKFWAVVYAIDRDDWKYGVRINQDMCQTQLHGLSDGDELMVEFKHIVAVIR